MSFPSSEEGTSSKVKRVSIICSAVILDVRYEDTLERKSVILLLSFCIMAEARSITAACCN